MDRHERWRIDRQRLQDAFSERTLGEGRVEELRIEDVPGEPGRLEYNILFEYRGQRCTGVMHVDEARARAGDPFADLAEIAAGALADEVRRAAREAGSFAPPPAVSAFRDTSAAHR